MMAREWCSERLIEILLPRGGFLAVLEAYFDESERESGTFCVAGLMFTKLNAVRFSKAWSAAVGSRTFHAVDVIHRKEEFSDFTRDDSDALLRRLAPIVNQRRALSIAVTCNLKEVERLKPQSMSATVFAYALCAHFAMSHVGHWVRANSPKNRVAYMFENGREGEAAANLLISAYLNDRGARDQTRYRSHTFQPKEDSVLLQGADLMAWEWAKYCDETVERKIRAPRKSIIAMLGGTTSRRFVGDVLSGQPLEDAVAFFDRVVWPNVKSGLWGPG